MSKIRAAFFAVLFVLAAFCSSAASQSANDWQNLHGVRAGTRVIVGLQNGQTLAGKLRNVRSDGIEVRSGKTPVTVSRADIKSVHRAKRGSIVGRALIGAAAGGGIGVAVGVGLAAAMKDPLAGAAGILFGVPAGAVIGAATKGKSKRGELLYYAP